MPFRNSSSNAFRTTLAAIAVMVAALPAGCNQNWIQEKRDKEVLYSTSTETNVTQVRCYFSTNPWLSFDEAGDPNPEGFKVTLYLISGSTGRGVFADGTVHVELFEIPQGATGYEQYRLAHEWYLEPNDVFPYRVRKKTVLGWGHQLRLNWKDADVLGKEVAVRVSFTRRDGRTVKGQTKFLKVPRRKEAW